MRAEAGAYYYLDHEVWGHRQIEVVRAENYLPRGSYRHLLLDSSHTVLEEDPPGYSMDRATENKVRTDPPDQAVGKAYQIGYRRVWRYYQIYLDFPLL